MEIALKHVTRERYLSLDIVVGFVVVLMGPVGRKRDYAELLKPSFS